MIYPTFFGKKVFQLSTKFNHSLYHTTVSQSAISWYNGCPLNQWNPLVLFFSPPLHIMGIPSPVGPLLLLSMYNRHPHHWDPLVSYDDTPLPPGNPGLHLALLSTYNECSLTKSNPLASYNDAPLPLGIPWLHLALLSGCPSPSRTYWPHITMLPPPVGPLSSYNDASLPPGTPWLHLALLSKYCRVPEGRGLPCPLGPPGLI